MHSFCYTHSCVFSILPHLPVSFYIPLFQHIISMAKSINIQQSALILLCHKSVSPIYLTKLWLFYLTCRITWNFCKYNFLRSFISWKLKTEFIYFLLCTCNSVLYLYDSCCLLAKSSVWKSDNCRILIL